MNLHLYGVGTALPRFCIEQADAAEVVKNVCCDSDDQARMLSVLYRRSGVKRRYSVVLHQESGGLEQRQDFFRAATDGDRRGPTTAARMARFESDAGQLAVAAARAALADAGLAAHDVSHLITVTCSGFYAPGFDAALFRDLPLLPETTRTQLGFMGCHGALNALRVARALAGADPSSVTLICCVELCSLHHQYGWDPDRIVANSLFADGAAAVLCGGTPRRMPDQRAASEWVVVDNGSTLIPDTARHMGWRVGDHGFEMTLSAEVPELIYRHLGPWLETWLARHELSIKDVGCWAIHPGGPRILSACGESAGLAPEQLADSREVLAEFGNMSSPTVVFILERLRRRGAPLPCVLLGFGPGLAIEAALVR
ncbi:MAG: type III polyketide synthase [Planctomycetaceae bacterium]